MDFRVFVEPQQGATYHDQLRVAQTAELLGFSAFFRSDHLARIGPGDPGAGPTDSWVTLGALARETNRLRLGTLVTSATFRLPGPLAIAVAQVDQMSGGRVELGLGAGWYAGEHAAHAVPFPPVRERFDRYAEQLAILTGWWATPAGQRFDYTGQHYSISDSAALPKPVQRPGPPIIIGGGGRLRTPALAAQYAGEFNLPFQRLDAYAAAFDRVRAAATHIGRDPASIVLSAAHTVCVGHDDAEVDRRADAIGRSRASLRSEFIGTPAQVVDLIGQHADLGATRFYFQLLDMSDLDQLELIADQVVRQLS
jgi:F420-dependent oxidoreductase-like protein